MPLSSASLPLLLLALALSLSPDTQAAIEAPAAPGLSLQQLEDLRAKGIPDAEWPALLETLGRDEQSSAVRGVIKNQQPFPAAKLVEMLAHARLPVRLGALDLLEDAAVDTFGFDPWQEDPTAGANTAALARWKAWAETGGALSTQTAATLDQETFRAIALEIMSGNPERAERAMQRLDGFGLSAIAPIEAFFATQPNLEPAPKTALKVAEYRLVLQQAMPKQAAPLARDLGFGRAEAQSAALAALGKGGPGVLPVIADFLDSADPLVRESAVDAAFEAGQQHAVPVVLPRLDGEKTESVLHAMLRGLGQHARDAAQAGALARFLEHPAENVVISALEALGTNQAGDVSKQLTARLTDPRWRVRAAALETIGKRSLATLKDPVAERLQDDDQFVRVTAVAALQRVDDEEARRIFVEQFAKRDDLKAPIVRALFSNDKTPPGKIWDALWNAPPEVILQCLEALEDRDDYKGKRIVHAARFATHPNRDVAASALGLLASRGHHTALLLDALKSGDEVKQDAVLDQLRLPAGFLAGAAAAGSPAEKSREGASGNPILNRLYDWFGSVSRKPATNGASKQAAAPLAEGQAQPLEMRAVLERFQREGSPQRRFRAAVVLAGQGDTPAAQFLLDSLGTLSNLDRRAVAAALGNLESWASGATLDLATRLLRDEGDDVRELAVDIWLNKGRVDRLPGLLAEFSRPGSLLNPDDLYGWELDKIAQNPGARAPILSWAGTVLGSASTPEAHKVFALILLSRSGQAEAAGVPAYLDAPTPWLRRAAYRALGLKAAESRLDALLRDEAALVRAVLPFIAAPHNSGWRHWFDDARSIHDQEDHERNRSSSNRSFGAWAQEASGQARSSAPVLEALQKLTRDPSDLVRFEAQFALLRLGHPVDPGALAGLIAVQPADSRARSRLGNFLENHFRRLGEGYGVLVPLATDISEENASKMLEHFKLDQKKPFMSFAALAQLAPATVPAFGTAVAPASISEQTRQPAAPFRVVYFHKPGCRDCERVRDMLDRHARDFPRMLLEERNIEDSREAVLNEALSARFRLKDTLHQVTPAVFTQAGALVRDEITFPALGDLLRQTSGLTADPAWMRVGAPEITKARETITDRYETLSLGVVAVAGLLDGVNPCAFATIIFLLSYLQIARRTPGEILAVGTAFIAAVFLAYFLVGLGLAQVLTQLTALRIAGTLLNYLLAGFALVVAVLSFRDAQLAARGELGEMTLQMPGMLKKQIRSVIRTGTRARHFVWAAFAAGIVISLLELACTGQVYLPTILYMLRSGNTGALGHLLFYNLAFIAPLIIVFVLAWTGLRSDALIRFQKKRTALVKVLTGLLFLLLTAFLLFGHAVMAR